jgi:hypothetical protein
MDCFFLLSPFQFPPYSFVVAVVPIVCPFPLQGLEGIKVPIDLCTGEAFFRWNTVGSVVV